MLTLIKVTSLIKENNFIYFNLFFHAYKFIRNSQVFSEIKKKIDTRTFAY